VVGTPTVAFAEVSDTVATIPQHWFLAIPIAAALFLAGSFRWWLGALLAIVPAFSLLGSIDMTVDQYIGPALWREQGWPYFASLWGSDLLMLSALLLGIRRGWARRQPGHEARRLTSR
jgi:hypothetical protein